MSEITTYEKTKDSGIEWIGSVPSHWRVHTLYQLVTQVKEKNSNLQEKNLLSLSYGRIKRKDIDSPDGLLPASFDGYNIIEDGDIVLRLTDLQNDHTSLRVGLTTERGIITSAYTTLRPIDTSNSKYLFYLLHAFDLKKGFYGMGSGVRQGLNYAEVKELRVVLPDQDEQDNIVRFLDDQCLQIDAMIAEAKISIDDYKMMRESVVFEAVTKGLSKNCKTKDSGVDIIGEIPQAWYLRRLRFLCDVSTGNQDTQNAIEDGKYPFYVRSPIVERSNKYTFDCEGILMAGDGAGAGRIFHHAFGKYAVHQRVYCFRNFHNILPRYFYYYMSNRFSKEMDKGSAKSTVPSVRLPMLLNFKVTVPPEEEQVEICEYLDKQISLIDALILEKNELLQELESYKRSLIFETVTGKRKVV